jgi:glycosyltransferase involved in cell wall biosynthesis
VNKQFSFIILTYNEEIHLPRFLASIQSLNAPVFILDSGSTDNTIAIAEKTGATILQHAFENHPKQWHYALNNFDIQTPWVICLDADQVVTPELKEHLNNFRDEDHLDINGIYFNRKNFFKGRWIKHGGYSPFYLLKMIRFGVGFSDLNEGMDHRMVVPGNTISSFGSTNITVTATCLHRKKLKGWSSCGCKRLNRIFGARRTNVLPG